MAGMMAETYVLQALQNGLTSIRQNIAQLSEILDALSPAELQSAQNYFGDPKTQIIIAPGFPGSQTPFPFIGVTVAPEEQIAEQTPIGLAYDRIDNGDGTWTDVKGAPFHGTIKATIYTPNADLAVWLSAICVWALLSQFDFFLDTADMRNLQIGIGDYEPQPQWLPTFVFSRGVWISGEWDKTFTATPPTITSAIATGTFSWS